MFMELHVSKPEKKARWKHVKACSRSYKRQVFCLFSVVLHSSFSPVSSWVRAWGLRVTARPFTQHRWTPMTRLNAVLRLLPEDAPQRCYVCTVWLLPQHRNNSQKSNIEWWFFRDWSLAARAVKTNTTENSNKRADGRHMHAWSHTEN